MYILPEHKQEIKDIMRDVAVNHSHQKRAVLRKYKKRFEYFMRKYKGIDFNQVVITK